MKKFQTFLIALLFVATAGASTFPANSTSLDTKAFMLASSFAAGLGLTVDQRCIGSYKADSFTHHNGATFLAEEGELTIYNVAFGIYEEFGECPDPHHSVYVIFNERDKLLALLLLDI